MKKERPILFNGEMVRAVRAGRKTQTRRVVTNQRWIEALEDECSVDPAALISPYGKVGDRLWVRESWKVAKEHDDVSPSELGDCSILFLADGQVNWVNQVECEWGRSRPSIHMPRRFSRIVLQVVDVRIERIQDILEGDSMAEGCALDRPPLRWFRELWNSTNRSRGYGWVKNPWVWVVEFKVLENEG